LATYPITDFNIDTEKAGLKQKYRALLKSFKLKEALANIGFEYFTIGNVFLSIYFPIHRSLICTSCNTAYNAKKADWVTFKQYKFSGTCPHCGHVGELKREDTKSLSVEDMNLIKWNPEHIVVSHNPISGESEYYYTIPNAVKVKIQKGDKLFVNSVPWGFIEAVKNNQSFKFDKGNIFHLQNVTTGGQVEGIAVPPMLTLFSLVFYQATLRKANEAVAQEYLNPLRVVYPQAQSSNSDPVVAMSLRNFVSNMEDALVKHKRDKNHVLVAPSPIGYQALGGEGKNLLVSGEIQQAEQTILLSLGVSMELLSGTTNWTSSSVGLRMMESHLFSYTSRLQDFIDWVTLKTSTYLSMDNVEVSLLPFKLLDDDNLKNMLFQLASAGKASTTTLYKELGLDFFKEQEKLVTESAELAKTEVNKAFEIEQAQFLAAKKRAVDLKDNEEFTGATDKAQQVAEQLANADESTRRSFLAHLKTTDYVTYALASKMLEEYRNSAEHKAQTQQEVDDTAAQAGYTGDTQQADATQQPQQGAQQ
jgi:hypothetical protein